MTSRKLSVEYGISRTTPEPDKLQDPENVTTDTTNKTRQSPNGALVDNHTKHDKIPAIPTAESDEEESDMEIIDDSGTQSRMQPTQNQSTSRSPPINTLGKSIREIADTLIANNSQLKNKFILKQVYTLQNGSNNLP